MSILRLFSKPAAFFADCKINTIRLKGVTLTLGNHYSEIDCQQKIPGPLQAPHFSPPPVSDYCSHDVETKNRHYIVIRSIVNLTPKCNPVDSLMSPENVLYNQYLISSCFPYLQGRWNFSNKNPKLQKQRVQYPKE